MLIMPKFVEKNRLNMPSTRIRQEQEIVAQMVRIYCRQKEKHTDLCPDCKELLQYAHARLSHCPFGEKKPVCAKCKIHCYGKGYKERAKEIMAFSGPKLLLKHPILSMRHIMALFREPPEKPTAAKPRPLAKENN